MTTRVFRQWHMPLLDPVVEEVLLETISLALIVSGYSDYRNGLYGTLDFDKIVDENIASGANGSETILRASRNDHNWFGILSTLKTNLSDDLVLLTGLDWRDYTGKALPRSN